MQTGGMLLADTVWLLYLVDFCNLMTAIAKSNISFQIQTGDMILPDIT